MSLLNQKNNKDKKKGGKKNATTGNNQGSKFIQKPKSTGFVSKQSNTGSQRGSWCLPSKYMNRSFPDRFFYYFNRMEMVAGAVPTLSAASSKLAARTNG